MCTSRGARALGSRAPGVTRRRRARRWLRKHRGGREVVVVVNKVDTLALASDYSESWEALRGECHKLGFGDPIAMSAEHGDGLSDLYDALEPFGARAGEEAAAATAAAAAAAPSPAPAALEDAALDDAGAAFRARAIDTTSERAVELAARAAGPVTLAIVGRPNVGKSTLVNALLRTERVLTGPTPGVCVCTCVCTSARNPAASRACLCVTMLPLQASRGTRLSSSGSTRAGSSKCVAFANAYLYLYLCAAARSFRAPEL